VTVPTTPRHRQRRTERAGTTDAHAAGPGTRHHRAGRPPDDPDDGGRTTYPATPAAAEPALPGGSWAPGTERLLVSPEEAAEILGVSRNTVYDLMRTNALPSVKVGRLRRIPTAHLREYVQRLPRSLPQDHR
jgi:excisionase family DNA binding protein